MFDRFKQIPALLMSVLDRLNERERRLLSLATIGVSGFLIFLLISGTIANMALKNGQIAENKSNLEQVLLLADDYRKAKMKQEAQEQRLRSNPVSLFTHLQMAAQRYGLTLSDLNETKTPMADAKITETSVVLSLKQLSLDRMHAFLAAVEDSDRGIVKVTRLKTKARFDQPDLLDVQLTVSTWKSTP